MITRKLDMHYMIFMLLALLAIGSFFYASNSHAARLETAIENEGYKTCLEMQSYKRIGSGFNVSTSKCEFQKSHQRWEVTGETIKTIYNNRYYCLEAVAVGRGQNIFAAPCNNSARQKFNLGVKMLKIKSSVNAGLCLDVAPNKNVALYDCNEGDHQLWFASVHIASDKTGYGCLDVNVSSNNVQAWKDCKKGSNQDWILGSKQIALELGGDNGNRKCLSAPRSDNANVSVASCNENDDKQHFAIGPSSLSDLTENSGY